MPLLSKEQCENVFNGYRRIYWGIILMLFHIDIGPIQLLPNFIGYMIITSGISCLRSYIASRRLSRASIVAGILIFKSMIEFLIPFFEYSFSFPLPFAALIMGIISILEILLYYDILTSSSDILRHINDHSLAEETDRRLRIFLVLYTLISVAPVLMVFCLETPVLFVVFICGLILRLWLAAIFARLKRRYIVASQHDANELLHH